MIDTVLAELDRSLHGPARVKRRLLAEARAGLVDGADAYRAAGLTAAEAVGRAVAEFGTARQLAAPYQRELDLAGTRRAAAANVVLVPLCTLFWNVVWELNPYSTWHVGSPAWIVTAAFSVLTGLTALHAAAMLVATRYGRVDPPWHAQRRVRRLGLLGATAFLVVAVLLPAQHPASLRWPPAVLTLVLATTMALVMARGQRRTRSAR